MSEQTIKLKSSFSSNISDGHLGQGDNTAYGRMPKLRPPSLTSSKRRGSKTAFNVLVSKMTESKRINQDWVGVAKMEDLRSIPPCSLRQMRTIESLAEKERQFLSATVDELFASRLRSSPSIIGAAKVESFLSDILEDSHTLRLMNRHFLEALNARPNIMEVGFGQVTQLCREGQAFQFSHILRQRGFINLFEQLLCSFQPFIPNTFDIYLTFSSS